MTYIVAATTSELANDIRYFYLHPVDSRMQLSPYPEPIESRDDALKALALAQDFYDASPFCSYTTLTGPMGEIRSSYRGRESIMADVIAEHSRKLTRDLR